MFMPCCCHPWVDLDMNGGQKSSRVLKSVLPFLSGPAQMADRFRCGDTFACWVSVIVSSIPTVLYSFVFFSLFLFLDSFGTLMISEVDGTLN